MNTKTINTDWKETKTLGSYVYYEAVKNGRKVHGRVHLNWVDEFERLQNTWQPERADEMVQVFTEQKLRLKIMENARTYDVYAGWGDLFDLLEEGLPFKAARVNRVGRPGMSDLLVEIGKDEFRTLWIEQYRKQSLDVPSMF